MTTARPLYDPYQLIKDVTDFLHRRGLNPTIIASNAGASRSP
ncbi:MAG: hypothetical protein ACR2GH_15145 [Pseudonocardia sp.]